jgi:hypothetical protein
VSAGGNTITPPPQPAIVSVTVSPTAGSVLLGNTLQFSATVSNSTNAAVTWSVDGISGGNSSMGTISSAGVFTAPQTMPQAADVVTATSVSDTTKSAAATVTIASDVSVAVIPTTANVQAAGSQQFTATISSAGHPSNSVIWSVNGIPGGNAAFGTISPAGLYSAPQIVASPLNVTIQAQSIADPTKSAAATVQLLPATVVTVAVLPGSATISLGASQSFSAQVSGANDKTVSWDVNGFANGNSIVGTLTPASSANSVIYAAPPSLPTPPSVTLRARSNASPSATATANITLVSGAVLSLAPLSATLAVSHRQTFNASITGAANSNVNWFVNGIAGGNTGVGQVCAAASNPCQSVFTAPAGNVDFLAPAAVPASNTVTLTAVSQSDAATLSSAAITILPHIVVSVTPPSASVNANASAQFSAAVLGTVDQDVIWNVSGPACSAAGACGVISGSGVFTAPISAPSPDAIAITATSSEDTSRTGAASVTISTAPAITAILPASALAGAAGGFTVRVEGGNFAVSPSTQSATILIGGAPRTTVCASAGDCSTTLTSQDLSVAANLSVQVENPDGSISPPVNFVIVAPTVPGLVSLAPSNPLAAAMDIVVVEPSTAGSTLPQSNVTLAIQAIGVFSAATNTCALGASPVILPRPSTGTATIDICAFSVSGLDPSFTYSISGPAAADVTIAAKQPLGLGIVDLTFLVPATAQVGARTLFIENPNKDKAAASGALEVR